MKRIRTGIWSRASLGGGSGARPGSRQPSVSPRRKVTSGRTHKLSPQRNIRSAPPLFLAYPILISSPLSWNAMLRNLPLGGKQCKSNIDSITLCSLQREGSQGSLEGLLSRGFPGGSGVKSLPVMQEMWVRSLGQEDLLQKEMAIPSSILAWRIPWTEEAGGLQSSRSQSLTRP